MSSVLRFGFVGVSRGSGLVRTVAHHPRAEVSALCDRDEKKLEQVGSDIKLRDSALYSSYHDMISSDLDAIVIATPIEQHKDQSIEALQAGKHVLCEQTAAYTIDGCEELVNTVKKSGKNYMMAENYCYFHYIRKWKELVAAGKLGKIYYAEGEYIHEIVDLLIDPHSGDHLWRYTRAPIWYCAHTLGPVLTLMDDRIVRATGVSSGKNTHPDEPGIGFLDMEVGLFQTQRGAVVKILRSQVAKRYGAGNSHMVWYSLYGTEGFIEAGREGGGHTNGLYYSDKEMTKEQGAEAYDCNTTDLEAPAHARTGGHGTSEFYMIDEFVSSIEEHRLPAIDVMRALDFTIPGIVAHEAATKGGVWMDVPTYNW